MSGISSSYHERLVKCLASRDRVEAQALLTEVQGALAAGQASGSGFQDDVIRLSVIAGVPLGKAAPRRPEPMEKRAAPALPPHLEALAKDAVARIENAGGALAKADAIEHGRAVKKRLDDFIAGLGAEQAMRAAHRHPKGARR